MLINCQIGGTCNGGNPGPIYKYAMQTGLGDSSCMQYVAKNLESNSCEAIDMCRDCSPPPPAANETGLDGCYAVDHKMYYISSYYSLSGADKMKAELYANGPMSCGIDATPTFEEYAGGIYSEEKRFPLINHEISVVGYGYDEDSQ